MKAVVVCLVLVAAVCGARQGVNGTAEPPKLWEVPFAGELALSPFKLSNNTVAVGSEDGVVAVNTDTGAVVWHLKQFALLRRREAFNMDPFVQDNTFCFATSGQQLVAVNVTSGSVLWTMSVKPYLYGYAGEGVVVLTTVTGDRAFSTTLTAVELITGQLHISRAMVGANTMVSPESDIVVTMGHEAGQQDTKMFGLRIRCRGGWHGFEVVYVRTVSGLRVYNMHFAGPSRLAGVMEDANGNNVATVFDVATGLMVYTDHGKLNLGGYLGCNGSVVYYAGTDSNTTAVNTSSGDVLWTVAYQPIYEHFFGVDFKDGYYLAFIGPAPRELTNWPFSVYSQRSGRLVSYMALPYPGVGVHSGNNPTPLLSTALRTTPGVLFYMTVNSVTAVRLDAGSTLLWENLKVSEPQGMTLVRGDTHLVLAYGPTRAGGYITAYDVSQL